MKIDESRTCFDNDKNDDVIERDGVRVMKLVVREKDDT